MPYYKATSPVSDAIVFSIAKDTCCFKIAQVNAKNIMHTFNKLQDRFWYSHNAMPDSTFLFYFTDRKIDGVYALCLIVYIITINFTDF